MRNYTAAVILERITFKAADEQQAEEMYKRWYGCGEDNTCPHHPDVEVGDGDWDCGCAETDEDADHLWEVDR